MEPLPADDPSIKETLMGSIKYLYNKTWRRKHPKKRQEGTKRYYAKTGGERNNRNHRTRWTIREVASLFGEGRFCDRELHIKLGRSVKAIQVQRSKFKEGKIT